MISADTNLFVYALDLRERPKQEIALAVIGALGRAPAIIGLQVVGELQHALRRRLRLPLVTSVGAAHDVFCRFATFAYDSDAVAGALREAGAGRLGYWDALLLAAAEAVGVKIMLSEDMADGLVFGDLEVVNPFAADGPSHRVRELLRL